MMKVSPTCGSGPEAPWPSAACSSPDKKSECSHCEGSEFISECTPSLTLNVLFHKSMNIGTESDGRGEKALKTHRASTLTARLLQRGRTVIRPGVSGSHIHVVLFKLTLSLHSLS